MPLLEGGSFCSHSTTAFRTAGRLACLTLYHALARTQTLSVGLRGPAIALLGHNLFAHANTLLPQRGVLSKEKGLANAAPTHDTSSKDLFKVCILLVAGILSSHSEDSICN